MDCIVCLHWVPATARDRAETEIIPQSRTNRQHPAHAEPPGISSSQQEEFADTLLIKLETRALASEQCLKEKCGNRKQSGEECVGCIVIAAKDCPDGDADRHPEECQPCNGRDVQ